MKTILILAANPYGELRIDREIRDLTAAIERSQKAEEFAVVDKLAVRPGDLQDIFSRHNPYIVHFGGHGAAEKGLVFENDEYGSQLVSNQALSGLFNLFGKNVQCVLLNACTTEIQANVIGEHVPYVIGTSREIRDRAAYLFAVGFYKALGNGESIEVCFAREGWSAEQCQMQFRIAKDRLTNLFKSYIAKNLARENTEEKYPQDRVLHWLGWLATTMVNESKTIFLIEKLQPSLLKRKEKRDYRNNNFLGGLIVGSSFGLIIGLVVWSIINLIFGICFGVTFAIIGGLIVCLSPEITLHEEISLSWQKVGNKSDEIRFWFIVATLVGFFVWLTINIILSNNSNIDIIFGLIFAPFIGAIVSFCFFLNTGLSRVQVLQTTLPNQGIKNSIKNAVKIGTAFGLIGLVGVQLGQLTNLKPLQGLILGLIISLISGLTNGGATCIQHFNLRLILHIKGRIPWNYARFLDYASERLLMKKVGGGYIFYHRMLMEHFARRDQRSTVSFPVTPSQTPQPVTRTNSTTNVSNTLSQPSNPVQNQIVCPNCTRHNPSTNKFCIKCGSKLFEPS